MARGFIRRAGSGGNPLTYTDRLVRKHGIRAPRRKVIAHEPDGYGWGNGLLVLKCGHKYEGTEASVGGYRYCYECRHEMTLAAEAASK